MNSSELAWFKSTYSGNDDPDCVEVALAWRKSSYSSNDGPDCVEIAVAATSATIHVRDTKDRHGPQLAFGERSWTGFIQSCSAES
ncbi:DUF397 domain-containing protein [Streptomyces griseoviridis]|uniref:DUF397 domain-containing protein n=1 Tax=Streptomyces TaxID=1883 RepID=UPI0024764D78|nr:DUF397 domain-containing protein [Streptomyces sp. MAA16]MDH6699862.1 hypothetical protein [Streptomyces sp. MAA16]